MRVLELSCYSQGQTRSNSLSSIDTKNIFYWCTQIKSKVEDWKKDLCWKTAIEKSGVQKAEAEYSFEK